MTTLKLADPTTNEHADILPFEQRRSHRRPLKLQVTALREADPDSGVVRQIVSLDLRDMSETGLGARCTHAMPAGASLTIFFQPHGTEGGAVVHGRIVRSRPTPTGHDIGIRLLNRAAA
jgi:hypothetical protein